MAGNKSTVWKGMGTLDRCQNIIVSWNSDWRKLPATSRQLYVLKMQFKVEGKRAKGLTRGQASDLLDILKDKYKRDQALAFMREQGIILEVPE
jgi:hypothetical protein